MDLNEIREILTGYYSRRSLLWDQIKGTMHILCSIENDYLNEEAIKSVGYPKLQFGRLPSQTNQMKGLSTTVSRARQLQKSWYLEYRQHLQNLLDEEERMQRVLLCYYRLQYSNDLSDEELSLIFQGIEANVPEEKIKELLRLEYSQMRVQMRYLMLGRVSVS